MAKNRVNKRKFSLLEDVVYNPAPGQFIKTHIVSTLSDRPDAVYILSGIGPRVHEDKILSSKEAKQLMIGSK